MTVAGRPAEPAPAAVHGFLHAGILVRDLPRAREFYGRLLGLPEIPRPDLGFPGAWYGLGAFQLHLIVPPPDRSVGDAAERFAGRVRHLAFRVGGFEPLVERLEREGHPFWPAAPAPDGARRGFTRDPDGNVLELVEAPPAPK